MSKFEQFNQKPQEGKKIITEESFGKSLSDEEIKERRKMIEDMENSQRNRGEYKSDIELAKEKIEKGELITSIEAGLLRAEDYENIEKETEKEIKNYLNLKLRTTKKKRKTQSNQKMKQ